MLFDIVQPRDALALMETMDAINDRYGKRKVVIVAQGFSRINMKRKRICVHHASQQDFQTCQ